MEIYMNYNELNKETKLFLNKAMDVYSTIKDKRIIRTVKDINEKDHEFTKLDKKVLALFIAGYLTDGNLKKILLEYDDIKLDNLFEFIGIKESDITPLIDENYEEFFERYFKLDLVNIIKERNWKKEIDFITPEVVISSLQYVSLNGSKILDYFARKYNIGSSLWGLSEHPVFNALKNYTLMDGSISEKVSPKKNNIDRFSLFPGIQFEHTETVNIKPREYKRQLPNQFAEKIENLNELTRAGIHITALSNGNKELASRINKANELIKVKRINAFKQAVANGTHEDFLANMPWMDKSSLLVDMGLFRIEFSNEKPLTDEEQLYSNIIQNSIDKDIEKEALSQGFDSVDAWKKYNAIQSMNNESQNEIFIPNSNKR